MAQQIKNLPAIQKMWVQSLGQEDPLEEEITTHSSIPAWRIPWTEDPMDGILPGSSVYWILQARILEWVIVSFSRGSSWPRDWTRVSCIFCTGRWILYHWATWLGCMCAKSLQSCLTLCDPMDYSPPGSSVHRIFKARILEWVTISFSRGSSWPRDWTHIFCIADGFFTTEPLWSPLI